MEQSYKEIRTEKKIKAKVLWADKKTIEEIAVALKVSYRTVIRWLAKEKINL